MATCKIKGCSEEMVFMILGVCKTCYNGLRYWRGRRRYDKERRLKQLVRLNGRMEHMIDHPLNVPKKKRRK